MKKKKKKNCRPKSSKKLQKLVIHIFTLIFMYIFTKFQLPNWIRWEQEVLRGSQEGKNIRERRRKRKRRWERKESDAEREE